MYLAARAVPEKATVEEAALLSTAPWAFSNMESSPKKIGMDS